MSNEEHLLVAVDISNKNENFCQQAIQIAKKFKASVTLAYAIEYIPYYPYFPYDEEKVENDLTDEIKGKMTVIKKLFNKEGVEVNDVIINKDKAYKVICEAADKVNATRIVIGVGPHYLLESVIGSTADKVIRQAHQAVFLINPYKNIAGMTRLLCGYDFSKSSDKALISASKLAKKLSAEFNIIHVVPETVLGLEALAPDSDQFNEIKDKVISKVKEKVDLLTLEDVNIHVITGSVLSGIIEFVEHNDIELLVIGANSQNSFRRLFLGSTTEKIVRKAPCHIMTLKKDVVE